MLLIFNLDFRRILLILILFVNVSFCMGVGKSVDELFDIKVMIILLILVCCSIFFICSVVFVLFLLGIGWFVVKILIFLYLIVFL